MSDLELQPCTPRDTHELTAETVHACTRFAEYYDETAKRQFIKLFANVLDQPWGDTFTLDDLDAWADENLEAKEGLR